LELYAELVRGATLIYSAAPYDAGLLSVCGAGNYLGLHFKISVLLPTTILGGHMAGSLSSSQCFQFDLRPALSLFPFNQ
jgi:hypothetical protein